MEPGGDEEELVVLLDEAGHAVGTAPKATVHGPDTPLHLAFSCWIGDEAGRVLLTRRAPGKTFAGVWTNAVCGHPGPGERLADAVARRCHDELGLEVGEPRLLLPEFRYRAEQDGIVEYEICPVLLAVVASRTPVHPDPAEVDGHEWVDWVILREEVPAGTRRLSVWASAQLAELADWAGDPAAWPVADERQLPPVLAGR